jgi:hypothetical protein
MSAIVGYLDFIILGALIGTIPLLVNKFFDFPEWVGLALTVVIFIFIFFTDDGKALGGKIAIFDQSRTWNKSAKNAVAMQCAVFSKAGMNFKNYTEDEKSLVRCCIKNITRKHTQDSYLQNENSSMFKIQDSLESCK